MTKTNHEGLEHRPKRRSILRVLALAGGGLLAVLVLLYFVATSSAFFKAFIVPRIGSALGAELVVAEASLSPFSQVRLRDVQLRTTGPEPVVKLGEVTVRYSLSDILGGRLELHELALVSPSIHLTFTEEGTSNLDPLFKLMETQETPAPGSSEPAQVSLRDFSIKQGSVRIVSTGQDGAVQDIGLTDLAMALDQFANGQTGKLAVSGNFSYQSRAASTAAPSQADDRLSGKISTDLSLTVAPDLAPQSAKGSGQIELSDSGGSLADLKELRGAWDLDWTPKEIKELAVRFDRGNLRFGRLSLHGPWDLEKSEGRLNMAIEGLDQNVLNLAGAVSGWKFGSALVNSKNVLEISQAGAAIRAQGNLTGQKIQIRQQDLLSPEIHLDLAYQASVNLEQSTAAIQQLSLTGRQNAQAFLEATLDQPMNLSWGTAQAGVPDSILRVRLADFDLSQWQALIGTNLASGLLNAEMRLRSENDGKRLAAELSSQLSGLSLRFESNRIDQAEAKLDLKAAVEEMRRIQADHFAAEVRRQGLELARVQGTARVDLESDETTASVEAAAALPAMIEVLQIPDLQIAAGQAQITSEYSSRGGKQTAQGKVQLQGFNGQYGDYRYESLDSAMAYDLAVEGSLIRISQTTADFRHGAQPVGRFELTGTYDTAAPEANVQFQCRDLNQSLIEPVLRPLLGEARLVSMTLAGAGSARYAPAGDSMVKTALDLQNLVVLGPGAEKPAQPWRARLQLEGVLRTNEVELRNLEVEVPKSGSASAQLKMAARYHLTNETAQATFSLSDVNEQTLQPILDSFLSDIGVTAIAIQGSGSASYDPSGKSDFKSNLQIENLRLAPAAQANSAPLSLQVGLDSSLQNQILDLRNFHLKLGPTARARNELSLQGRLDLRAANRSDSRLTLQAESLDLTDLYGLLAGSPSTNPPAASAPVETELEPMELPLQPLTARVQIDRLFLGDIALTNLHLTAAAATNVASLETSQWGLNGAPVQWKARLNTAVAGWNYDLDFRAERVPLQPLADTFSPETAGRYQGELIASAQLRGQGITGPSLQKHLTGQTSLTLTNLNLEIVGRRVKRLLDPLALALRVPELTQTPLNWVDLQLKAGQGQVDVSRLGVLSQAFVAQGQGTIQLQPILTNSTLDIPITLALRRSLAEKSKLVPANAPADTPYVALPTFAKLDGTLGDPKTEINKLAVSGILLQTAAQIPKVNEKTGNLLQGLGGFLAGQKPAATTTNQPPAAGSDTNQPPKFNPLDLLRLLPDKKEKE